MAKKQAVKVVVPLKRPAKLEAEFTLETRDQVDDALAELSWCNQRLNAIDGELQELHEAIELKRPKMVALKFDQQETTIADRAEVLHKAIQLWTEDHLKEHLATDADRKLDLAHGSLSYRKLELVIGPQEGLTDEIVLARIEKLTAGPKPAGLLSKARQICAVTLSKVLKLIVGDLVKVNIALNREGMIAAYKAKRLNDKTLKSLGLVAVDDRERYSFKVN